MARGAPIAEAPRQSVREFRVPRSPRRDALRARLRPSAAVRPGPRAGRVRHRSRRRGAAGRGSSRCRSCGFHPGFEQAAPVLARVKEPAHDGADRDAQDLGDLAVAEFRLGVQHEGLPLWEGELRERLVEFDAQVGPFQVEAGVGMDERFEILAAAGAEGVHAQHVASASLPSQVKGGIAHHAEQPGLEGAASLKTGKMGERFDKRFLHGVESVGLVAEQAVGDAIRRHTVAVEKLVEGLAVPRNGKRQKLFVAGRQQGQSCSHELCISPMQTLPVTSLFDCIPRRQAQGPWSAGMGIAWSCEGCRPRTIRPIFRRPPDPCKQNPREKEGHRGCRLPWPNGRRV
jgi:hypothetical protein